MTSSVKATKLPLVKIKNPEGYDLVSSRLLGCECARGATETGVTVSQSRKTRAASRLLGVVVKIRHVLHVFV